MGDTSTRELQFDLGGPAVCLGGCMGAWVRACMRACVGGLVSDEQGSRLSRVLGVVGNARGGQGLGHAGYVCMGCSVPNSFPRIAGLLTLLQWDAQSWCLHPLPYP